MERSAVKIAIVVRAVKMMLNAARVNFVAKAVALQVTAAKQHSARAERFARITSVVRAPLIKIVILEIFATKADVEAVVVKIRTVVRDKFVILPKLLFAKVVFEIPIASVDSFVKIIPAVSVLSIPIVAQVNFASMVFVLLANVAKANNVLAEKSVVILIAISVL